MSSHEFVGPPISRAGPVEAISPKRSLLSKVGQGLISFARDVPVAQLETEQSQRDIEAQQVALNQQRLEANQAAIRLEQEIQQLSNIAFDPNNPDKDKALTRLFQLKPEFATQVQKGLRIETQAGLENAARRAASIQAQPTKELRDAEIRKQINENPNLDLTDTEQLLGMTFEEQEIPLRVTQAAALSTQQRATGTSGAASKLGQGIVVEDAEGEFAFATPVLGPSGEVVTQTTPIIGVPVSRQLAETSARRQQRDIETAGGEVTARGVSKRDQDFIDVGQRQADGTAIIRRGIQLLDIIKTGAPESVALAAKNLFGIAGADETELNANLGKAVLSQLRTTFGAQFTQQEGERLQRLEAGFGKSTAGNKRLLEQTLRIMERDARRGIDVARRQVPADEFSATEIESALKFTLTPPEEDELDPTLLEFMTPEQRALFEQ